MIHIIPTPVEARPTDGQFTLDEETEILLANESRQVDRIGEYLAGRLNRPTGYRLNPVIGSNMGDVDTWR